MKQKITDEKTIVSAEIKGVPFGILTIIVGGIISATCLVWETILGDWAIFASAILGGVIAIIGLIIIIKKKGSGLYVTNKRVYGQTLLGKRVDIPLDSISSISLTFSLLSGVSVASSSGKITFLFISERDKIYDVISNFLIERQSLSVNHTESTKDTVDELKKYKELLDTGIITQQEFETKKKELLGEH